MNRILLRRILFLSHYNQDKMNGNSFGNSSLCMSICSKTTELILANKVSIGLYQ